MKTSFAPTVTKRPDFQRSAQDTLKPHGCYIPTASANINPIPLISALPATTLPGRLR